MCETTLAKTDVQTNILFLRFAGGKLQWGEKMCLIT